MAASPETVSMAMFCDFENVALGVRDAKYEKFDIKPVLERSLLKGSIVLKKAYCDWERYKAFKATMHEANFELIEIPHVWQSAKNSADIRMVVDALDLCYTKSHVNTFVIVSGDSDFSPLVSKLRENAKYVIGVGVKKSTSDLLIANCDEFIFYDDLVRESQRGAARSACGADGDQTYAGGTGSAATRAKSGRRCSRRRSNGASLISTRATSVSAVSAVCSKRRRTGACSKSAATRNLAPSFRAAAARLPAPVTELTVEHAPSPEEAAPKAPARRRSRGGRKTAEGGAKEVPATPAADVMPAAETVEPEAVSAEAKVEKKPAARTRRPRKSKAEDAAPPASPAERT